MRSPRSGNRLSWLLEIVGAGILIGGVAFWFGFGPAVTTAGVLLLAAGFILDI